MSQIQDMVDGTAHAGILSLRCGEFEGPLRLARPITVEASGATLWARQGPVLVVESEDVVLRNLRVEVTAADGAVGADARVALKVLVSNRVTLDHVVVRGVVEGLPGEADEWAYPDHLDIGRVAARKVNEYLLRVEVPVPCQVTSAVAGLTLSPQALQPGLNDVLLSFRDIPSDTLLVGQIELRSAFLTRVVGLSANTMSGTKEPPAPAAATLLWEPPASGRKRQPPPPKPAPTARQPEPPRAQAQPPASKPSRPTSKAPSRKQPAPPAPAPAPPTSTPSPASRYVTSDRPLGSAFSAPPAQAKPADVRRVEASSPPPVPAEVAAPPSQRVSVAALSPLFAEPPSSRRVAVPGAGPLFDGPSQQPAAPKQEPPSTDSDENNVERAPRSANTEGATRSPKSADETAGTSRQQKRPLLSSLFTAQQEGSDDSDDAR